MPRESGASSNHRPLFYLKDLWLLDRPLSRAMTNDDSLIYRLEVGVLGELHGGGEVLAEELAKFLDAHLLR